MIAEDSAEGIYRKALGVLGTKVEGIDTLPLPALKAILTAQPLPGSKTTSTTVAMDSAAVTDFAKRFPDADRIGRA